MRTSAGEPDEVGKAAEVGDAEEVANVALDVGRDVVGQPLVGRDPAIENPRVRSGPEHLAKLGRRGREPVGLPDWRGPVTVTTGSSWASSARRRAAVRVITRQQ